MTMRMFTSVLKTQTHTFRIMTYEQQKAERSARAARVAFKQFLGRWCTNKFAPNEFKKNGKTINLPYSLFGMLLKLDRDQKGKVTFCIVPDNKSDQKKQQLSKKSRPAVMSIDEFSAKLPKSAALQFAKMHLKNIEIPFNEYWPYWRMTAES